MKNQIEGDVAPPVDPTPEPALLKMHPDPTAERSSLEFSQLNLWIHQDILEKLEMLLRSAAKLDELTEGDRSRHVFSPCVEAGETWCVAIFSNMSVDPEVLKGSELGVKFNTVLVQSERGAHESASSATPDKNVARRRAFCQKHAKSVQRLESRCFHYVRLVSEVAASQPLLRTDDHG